MENIADKTKESIRVNQLLFNYKHKTPNFGSLPISMIWTEKFFAFLISFQLYNLIYESFLPIWPISWKLRYSSSYLSLLSLDITVISHVSESIPSSIRLAYSVSWLFIGSSLLLTGILASFFFSCSRSFRCWFLRHYFKAMDFLYIPICLGLIPTAMCRYDDCQITGTQITISLLTIIVCGVFAIGYPVFCIFIIKKHEFVCNDDHEDTLKTKELEQVLGISSEWLYEKMYFFSSFKATWLRIYYKPIRLFFSLGVIIVHAGLYEKHQPKIIILLIMFCAFTGYSIFIPIYRCGSSNILNILLNGSLLGNIFIAYLKLNDKNSQYMKDANLSELIYIINIFSAIVIGVALVIIFITRPKWPTNAEDVKILAASYRYVLNDFRNAQIMISRLQNTNEFMLMFIQPKSITGMIEILYKHYNMLQKENHPLQFTAIEQLDALTHYESLVKTKSLLISPVIIETLPIILDVLKRRGSELIMMSPVKRRILLKITALRIIINGRNTVPFTIGVDIEEYWRFKPKSEEVNDETMITIEVDSGRDVEERYPMSCLRKNESEFFEDSDDERVLETKMNREDRYKCRENSDEKLLQKVKRKKNRERKKNNNYEHQAFISRKMT
ncbi:hypothetical protein SteCoe_17742 [Stentor coeruleus]|uniref:Uncharacterized protein n=1 Tax=Stentor coeruleus TaxID=5963 RepID=A0A1R2BYM5_9CILI|nr:hypothetical protein SteCoe_17742 [Stentor coeruleus]